MIERLFFDRVDMGSDDFTVNVGVELSLFILPDTTDTEFRIRYLAAMIAEKTGNLPLSKGSKEHGFSNHLDGP